MRVRETEREKEKKGNPEYMPSLCIVCEAASWLFLDEISRSMKSYQRGILFLFPLSQRNAVVTVSPFSFLFFFLVLFSFR